tara:strand:- start:84 stop:356 length:273 start_codon:yes stop_codon:yes gene_type:complete
MLNIDLPVHLLISRYVKSNTATLLQSQRNFIFFNTIIVIEGVNAALTAGYQKCWQKGESECRKSNRAGYARHYRFGVIDVTNGGISSQFI